MLQHQGRWLGCAMVSLCASAVCIAGQWDSVFTEEMRQSFAHFRAQSVKLQGKLKWSIQDTGEKETVDSYEMKQNARCALLTMTVPPYFDMAKKTTIKKALAYCVNPKYSFRLEKYDGGGWQLNRELDDHFTSS